MFRIIAIIAAIRVFATKAELVLQDTQARVAGAGLHATAQHIALTAGNRENVGFTHAQRVEEIRDKLTADINAAYKAHTDALQALDRSTDAIVAVHNKKLDELRAKRDKFRAALLVAAG